MTRLAELFQVNLKRYRQKADLSQNQLGARAGYTGGYVSSLERGIRVPTLETIEHLAGAMGLADPRMFFRGGKS